MHGPFGAQPLRSIINEGLEAPAPKKSVVESATMSNNVSMQLGSAFLTRPPLGTDIEPMVEPKVMSPQTPRVGCDNQGKLAWTIEDLIGDDDPALYDISREWNNANRAVNAPAHIAEDVTFDPKTGFAVAEEFDADSSKVIKKLKGLVKAFGAKFKIASNAPHFLVSTDKDVEMLLHKVKKSYPELAKPKTGYSVMAGPGGKKVVVFKPTALSKYESVMEAEPGEFDSASGGIAPGKKQKIKVEGKKKLHPKLRKKIIQAIYKSTSPKQRSGGSKDPAILQMTGKHTAEPFSLNDASDEQLLSMARKRGKHHLSDYGKFTADELASVLSEGKKGKQKLHPSMLKHTDSDAFKAHVGDNDDDEKPFHKGKHHLSDYGKFTADERKLRKKIIQAIYKSTSPKQ